MTLNPSDQLTMTVLFCDSDGKFAIFRLDVNNIYRDTLRFTNPAAPDIFTSSFPRGTSFTFNTHVFYANRSQRFMCVPIRTVPESNDFAVVMNMLEQQTGEVYSFIFRDEDSSKSPDVHGFNFANLAKP